MHVPRHLGSKDLISFLQLASLTYHAIRRPTDVFVA